MSDETGGSQRGKRDGISLIQHAIDRARRLSEVIVNVGAELHRTEAIQVSGLKRWELFDRKLWVIGGPLLRVREGSIGPEVARENPNARRLSRPKS
ncbi:MAG: hypothetical protein AAFV09_07835 [Pseudomonadota bacterium]